MFVFGVDVPLVELVVFFTVIAIILLIEIIVVVVLQLYQMKENKKMLKNSLSVAKILLQLKDRELELRKLRKKK